MKVKLIRHLWGVDLASGLNHYLAHWKKINYEGVEVSLRLVPDQSVFLRFLRESRLQWVPQIFSHDFIPGGSVREHLHSLKLQMEECLDHQPLFFNGHTGHDNWTTTQAEDFYGESLVLEKQIGIPLSHETHRSRYFGSPWQTRHILNQFPELRVTCDFSHWVCVCERLLPDLGETIALAAWQCHHIHARVGFEQGPQVPDPSAPEYALHLKTHEDWWDIIWRSQLTRGYAESTLTPEFGPPPYLHTIPHSNAPIADLPKVCDWMAQRQQNRFNNSTKTNSHSSFPQTSSSSSP